MQKGIATPSRKAITRHPSTQISREAWTKSKQQGKTPTPKTRAQKVAERVAANKVDTVNHLMEGVHFTKDYSILRHLAGSASKTRILAIILAQYAHDQDNQKLKSYYGHQVSRMSTEWVGAKAGIASETARRHMAQLKSPNHPCSRFLKAVMAPLRTNHVTYRANGFYIDTKAFQEALIGVVNHVKLTNTEQAVVLQQEANELMDLMRKGSDLLSEDASMSRLIQSDDMVKESQQIQYEMRQVVKEVMNHKPDKTRLCTDAIDTLSQLPVSTLANVMLVGIYGHFDRNGEPDPGIINGLSHSVSGSMWLMSYMTTPMTILIDRYTRLRNQTITREDAQAFIKASYLMRHDHEDRWDTAIVQRLQDDTWAHIPDPSDPLLI